MPACTPPSKNPRHGCRHTLEISSTRPRAFPSTAAFHPINCCISKPYQLINPTIPGPKVHSTKARVDACIPHLRGQGWLMQKLWTNPISLQYLHNLQLFLTVSMVLMDENKEFCCLHYAQPQLIRLQGFFFESI